MSILLTITLALVALAASNPIEAPPSKAEVETAEGERLIDHDSFIYIDSSGITTFTAYTTPALTLDQAKHFCARQGPNSELATIVSNTQLAFLSVKLKLFSLLLPPSARRQYWIAGTDLIVDSTRNEGQYWFYSGTPIDSTFWNVNEPNNFEHESGRTVETCTDLKIPAANPLAPYGVNDEVCTLQLSYICQSPGICED